MKYLILAVMIGAVPAQGMVYMWSDSAGVAHYTNKEYEIPSRYKATAKALYPDSTDSGQTLHAPPNDQKKPDVQMSPNPVQQSKSVDTQREPLSVETQQERTITPVNPVRRAKRHRGKVAEE